MNIFDVVIIGFLVFGAFKGYRKGFLLEAIAILSFILAIIGGFRLLHWGMSVLDEHFDINGELLPYLSFLLIFIVIVVGMNFIGRFLKKIIDMTLLGSVDNLAGALLAVLKWAFGISVILWLSNSFGMALQGTWTSDSILYPYLLTLAPRIVDMVSNVMPFASDLFETIQDLLKSDSSA
ncbi:MAG: CvpA family protein [Bacteroidota bacterium]